MSVKPSRSLRPSLTGVLLALVGAGIGGSPAYATYPGTNGKIAYVSNASGNLDIWTMNPDGTGKTNLTPDSPALDADPDWSPDGSRIAFTSRRSGNLEIYVMDADGSDLERLSSTPNFDQVVPIFSPDGSKIAFEGGIVREDAELWVMDADGTDAQQLTDFADPGFAVPADFSPDGEKIAFWHNTRSGLKTSYTMHVDGLHLKLLVPEELNGVVFSWSPYGNRLALADNGCPIGSCPASDILVVKSNGKGMTQITPENGWNKGRASWSPDGTKIAFDQGQPTLGLTDILVMEADGTGVANVTGTPGTADRDPDWGTNAGG